MKKLVVFFLFLLLGIPAIAGDDSQFGTRHVVKGEILDSLTREGEVSAVLQFFKAGSDTPIAFTTTGADGKFSQQIDGSGDFYMLFSNMGRLSRRIPFVLDGQETVDLGIILVRDDVQMLKAGTVTAQRPLVKMEVDKISYDVAHDDDARASTVLDMLRKVPMVTVDGQDNISVNGSSSFQVTVDGKPSQMFSGNPSQIFKMMPASAVESIEVITNPGVRYDAEGVGGVLNLKMARLSDGSKAGTDGRYGTIRLQGGNRGGGAGLFYSMQKGKFTMSLNANAQYQAMAGSYTDMSREQITPAGRVNTSSHSEFSMKVPITMGNFSASYEIDSLNLVSATAGLMRFGTINDGTGWTRMGGMSYDSETFSSMSSTGLNASVDYQHNWADRPGRTFTLSYQFSGTPMVNNSTNYFLNPAGTMLNLTDRKSESNSLSLDNTFQADFTAPLGKGQSISSGVKFLVRHNSSDSDLSLWDGGKFVYDEAGSMVYDFFNNIGAIYAEWSGNFGKFGLKAGARYEHTWQKYSTGRDNSFSTNYGDLVPTASIQYSFSPSSNLGLSYNMRISRPGISYLNPYRDTSDPTSLSYGNEKLVTEHAHNWSLVYNHYTPKLMVNLSGRYSYNDGGISSYSFYDKDNILNTTYGNVVTSRSTGMNAFLNWNAGPKTRVYLNGGASYNDFRSEVLDQSNHGVSYNAMIGVQQTLPSDFRISGNLFQMGRSYNLQGWSSGVNIAILGLSKSFLNDRLSFTLMGTTQLGKGPAMQMQTHSAGKDFSSDITMGVPIRSINLSVSFSFGGQRNIAVKTARRTISNDDQLNEASTAEKMNSSGVLGM